MYEQRDIVLIPFPYTDLTGAKQRPALIISNQKLNKSEDRICCLITSNQPKDGLVINDLEKGRLPFKSWVKPQRLFTIHEGIIKKKLSTVTPTFHKKVLTDLHAFLE
jgi:mRNA interferase MazF